MNPALQPPDFLGVVTGSFSTPAAGNPTVALIEAAYRQLGVDGRYLNCEVSSALLGDAVRGARAMGWVGFNCSLPHKVDVIPFLDELAPTAEAIGAVNCVVRRGDRLVGENTDGRGFLGALRTLVDPRGRAVVVLGAGGAARAVAVECARAGAASIVVVNRDRDRGRRLVELLETRTPAAARLDPWVGAYAPPEGTDILVNATSVGLHPAVDEQPELDLTRLSPATVVADLIPNPPRTAFLRAADELGCPTLDGRGMLVAQAALAVELWIGVRPDLARMRSALDSALDGG